MAKTGGGTINKFFQRFGIGSIKDRKDLVEKYGLLVSDEAQKHIRVIPWAKAAAVAAEGFEINSLYGNPFTSLMLVGNYARRNIGQEIKTYEYLRDNIHELDREEISNKLLSFKTTRDIDYFITFRTNINLRTRNSAINQFREKLPIIPDFIINDGFKRGFDIGADDIRTDNQLKESFDLFDKDEKEKLNPHELQIVDDNPEKDIIPVVLFQSEKMGSGLIKRITGRMKTGCLRDLETYYVYTWKPCAERFKKVFPQRYERMVEDVISDIENLRISPEYHDEVFSQIKDKITI